MAQMTLDQLKNRPVAQPAQSAEIGFSSIEGFVQLQRMANLFTCSSMVPETFRGQNNLGNAVIALDMAIRMKANPLAVMQNIYIVHGRPAWSAQFLIATLNKSGKFSAIRYEFEGKEGTDDWGCRACATELSTGTLLAGPLVTIGLAKREGWYAKNGSKWQTMPELMLRYRAASWFVRAYAPEIAMGLPEADELSETIDITPQEPEDPQENAVTVADIEKKAKRGRKPKAEVTPAPDPAPEQETELTPPHSVHGLVRTPEPVPVQEPEQEPVQEPEPEAEPDPMPEPQPERHVTPMGSYVPPSPDYEEKEKAFYAQK